MITTFFHQLARKELFDAREYYDDLVYGLGKSFITEVEKTFNVIKNVPSAYPVIKKENQIIG